MGEYGRVWGSAGEYGRVRENAGECGRVPESAGECGREHIEGKLMDSIIYAGIAKREGRN